MNFLAKEKLGFIPVNGESFSVCIENGKIVLRKIQAFSSVKYTLEDCTYDFKLESVCINEIDGQLKTYNFELPEFVGIAKTELEAMAIACLKDPSCSLFPIVHL